MLVVLAGCHWSRHEGLNPLEMIFGVVGWFEPPTPLCYVPSNPGILTRVSAWLFLLKYISTLCHLALVHI